jgi:predicted phosphate transport protein (TIGR00153 family)
MAKKSYAWFEKTRRTKLLELAQKQITTALDTVTLLNQAMNNISKAKVEDARQHIEKLFTVEEEIDQLRTEVFKELSKGAALFADYREDLLHLVKRLDTFADHVKDAARCIVMLGDAKIPDELWTKAVHITSTLVECATALRSSIQNISANPEEAMEGAAKVEEFEAGIDREYLETKSLFIKYAEHINCGALIIFDDMIEFLEEAADMCADTADYIVTLASSV